eukprot:1160151-Pelagomonas_calceolata.AAC.9
MPGIPGRPAARGENHATKTVLHLHCTCVYTQEDMPGSAENAQKRSRRCALPWAGSPSETRKSHAIMGCRPALHLENSLKPYSVMTGSLAAASHLPLPSKA